MVKKSSSFDSMFGQHVTQIAKSPNLQIGRIPTGIYALDQALEGGIPRGRISEFLGEFSTLKTTTALCAAKNVMANGERVLFIDLEGSLTDEYLASVGIEVNDTTLFDRAGMESAEFTLDLILKAVEDGRYSLIILDSVATLSPRAELEGEMGDALVGAVPRLLSKFCRKIQMEHQDGDTAIVLINQFRANIGYGNAPQKIGTGGKAIPFFASLKLEFSRIETLKKSEIVIGSRIQVNIAKSKVSRPFRKPTFNHFYDTGIDFVGSVLDAAIDQNIVRKGGAWVYIYGESFQGMDKARQFLSDNLDVVDQLKSDIKSAGIVFAELVSAEPEVLNSIASKEVVDE